MPELTSVATVQAYIGDTSISSSLLTTLINGAESEIARRCNRYDDTEQGNHWLSASRVQFIDGEYADYVMLKYTPVTALASCVIVIGSGSSTTIATTSLTMDGREIADLGSTTPGRMGKLAWRWGSRPNVAAFDYGYPMADTVDLGAYGIWSAFGGGPQRVKVTYTGGFASAPADLALAATMLAAQMYRDRLLNPSLQSETLGSYSYVRDILASAAKNFASVENLIAAHIRPAF